MKQLLTTIADMRFSDNVADPRKIKRLKDACIPNATVLPAVMSSALKQLHHDRAGAGHAGTDSYITHAESDTPGATVQAPAAPRRRCRHRRCPSGRCRCPRACPADRTPRPAPASGSPWLAPPQPPLHMQHRAASNTLNTLQACAGQALASASVRTLQQRAAPAGGRGA